MFNTDRTHADAPADGDNLWVAQRTSLSQDFGAPQPLANLNTPHPESDPALTGPAPGCHRLLVFESERDDPKKDLYLSCQLTPQDDFSLPVPWADVNVTGEEESDPFFALGQQQLLFEKSVPGAKSDLFFSPLL